MKIAIIGGGLAGAACAYVLKQAGATPVIYEAGESLAPGASGNEIGLYNPRFSAERSAEAQYYIRAFEVALEIFSALCHPDGAKRLEGSDQVATGSDPSTIARDDRKNSNLIDFNPCGALHLITDEAKAVRFAKTVQSWGWPDMEIVSAARASDIAGVALTHEALYLPRSGTVSPRKLCAAYAQGVEIHLNTRIEDLAEIEADAVVLAGGMGVLSFEPAAHLPLRPVRGQVTRAALTPATQNLKCTLGYGGYFTPAREGVHMLGATFQRWLDHSDILPEDDADNIAKLAAVAPALAQGLEVTGHRAAVRTTAPDHFPVAGRLNEALYISTAHGSHGILSSLMSAHLLVDMILGRSSSLPQLVVERLAPQRYDDAK